MAKGRVIDLTQEFKIYRNSTCENCIYDYIGELKIKQHPETKEDVIICRNCYTKLYKGI